MEGRLLDMQFNEKMKAIGQAVTQRLSIMGSSKNDCVSSHIFCRQAEDGLHLACFSNGDERQPEVRSAVCSSGEQVAEFMEELPRGLPVAAVLPKSFYMVKVLEIPAASPEEVKSILALEAEALVPSELGEVEISFSCLACEEGHAQRYEVYICRRSQLRDYISSLGEYGIEVDFVLPSAVIWRRVLAEDKNGLDALVVAEDSSSSQEIVGLCSDGSLSIRSINYSGEDDVPERSHQSLLEVIGASVTDFDGNGSCIAVGWMGSQIPQDVSDARLAFKDASQAICPSLPELDSHRNADPFTFLGAIGLLEAGGDVALSEANLLPRAMLHRRLWAKTVRGMALGAAAALVGVLISYIALNVLVSRSRNMSDELAGKIQQIKTEGETTGRRIAQLKAINALGSTQAHFYDLIKGLYDATPRGITYSSIELTGSGDVRLRGQAESIAHPFLLPRQLQDQAFFMNVTLRDAGLVKKVGGSVAEFRLDCQLFKETSRNAYALKP